MFVRAASYCLILSIIALYFLTSMIFPTDIKINQEQEQKTCLQKISDINMRSFPWEDDNWSAYSYVEWMKQYRPRRFNPQAREKRKNAFMVFKEIEKQHSNTIETALNDENTWQDLELFGDKKNSSHFFANALDRTVTEYGKIKLYWLMSQPIDKVDELVHRQTMIQVISQDEVLHQKINEQLIAIKDTENVFLSFWGNDSLKQSIDKSLPPTKILKENPTALFIGSTYQHIGNILGLYLTSFATGTLALYGLCRAANITISESFVKSKKKYQGSGGFVLAYLWEEMESKWPENRLLQAAFALTSATVCGLGIKRIVDNTNGEYLFDDFLQALMHDVSKTMRALQSLSKTISQNTALKQTDELIPLQKLFASKNKKIIEFIDLISSGTLQGKPSFLSHKGVVLRAFMLMHEIKNELVLAVNAAAQLDVYLSFAKLHQEFSKNQVQWCFADYVQAEKPSIDAVNFWHPMVDAAVVVPNSVQLGTKNNPANFVITGPNAGGKSTILKSLALCILMAQTIGMAPAEKFSLTPFSSIATYLNITDDIGDGNSRYKAEVLRVVELMNRIKNLKPGQHSFALFDEVFNGTSPHEGSAAAYSIIDHLAKYENSINLVATHFSLLTRLTEKNKRVANYKVSVVVHNDGRIEYPFKLEPGISHQHVAIDILRNEGVSNSILEQAQELLKTFVA